MASFLDLALETRRQIYQQLIVSNDSINQWDRQPKSSDLLNARQNYLALLRTCRQVHDEVRFVFYSVNSFSFNIVHQEKEDPALNALRSCNGSQILHCRISVRASLDLTEDFYKYKLVEAICECISKAGRLRRLEIEYKGVSYFGNYQMFRVTRYQRELMKFTSLGLLASIGRLVNVDDVAIEGDVSPEYKADLFRGTQSLPPEWPLPNMGHALQRYVTSFSILHSPVGAYKIEDDFWQIRVALECVAAGDMKQFKQHRRRVKKLGDLRGLDSSILYSCDLKNELDGESVV